MKRPRVAYLSGPMSGVPDFNFPAFHAAETVLRNRGWKNILNPATSFDGRQDLPRKEYMRKDIADLLAADVVYTLPGWEKSPGSRMEVLIAHELGLPVWCIQAWEEGDAENAGAVFMKVVPGGIVTTSAAAVYIEPTPLDWESPTAEVGDPVTEPPVTEPLLAESFLRDRSRAAIYADEIRVSSPEDKKPFLRDDESVLKEALALVNGDRQAAYGGPWEDFSATAEFWTTWLHRRHKMTEEAELDPEDVALMMALLKVSREAGKHKRDNLSDLGGYTECAQMVHVARERGLIP